MFSWRKKNLDELLLTPEQVIQELDEIRLRSKGSLDQFMKMMKKSLGKTFQALNVRYRSELHRFTYRGFLRGHFTAKDTFELIVALNQDKGELTRVAFERLLPLLTSSEWNGVLKSIIVPSESFVHLMAGFVLAYPEFARSSRINDAQGKAYLFQALFHWNSFAKKDLKEHVHYFAKWIELKNNDHVILDLLEVLLNLNDIDLVDMIVELVNAWLRSVKCKQYLRQQLFALIQKNSSLGDFVLIETLSMFVAANVIKRDAVHHWIKQWNDDDRIDLRRKMLRYLPNWLQEEVIDFNMVRMMLDNAYADVMPHLRSEAVTVTIQLFELNFIQFDELLSRIREFSRDSSILVKETLLRTVMDLNIESESLNAVLEVLKPAWLELLQGGLENDQTLTTCMKMIKLFYRQHHLTAAEVRHLVEPYLESPQWEIRHAAVQQLPFLISEGIFTKDEIRMLFRKEKNRTVRDAVERFMMLVK